jgi:hypothetical protein
MPDPITRRDFAELVALAAAAPFVAEGVGTRGSGLGMARPSTQPQAPSPEPSPLARALAESIRVRYDGRLSADDLTTITQGIESRLQGLERLYRVSLTNGDEPDFVFSVYRGPD